MSIAFSCICGKPLKAREEFAGRKIRCPGCQRILVIPTDIPAAVAPAEAAPGTPESQAAEQPVLHAESISGSPVLADDPLVAPVAALADEVPEMEVEILHNNAAGTAIDWTDRSLEQTSTPWRPEDWQRFQQQSAAGSSLWLILIAVSAVLTAGAVVAAVLAMRMM